MGLCEPEPIPMFNFTNYANKCDSLKNNFRHQNMIKLPPLN
jgi:hypothetical protein